MLIGETAREAGLLILVFGPLDWVFAEASMRAMVPASMALVGLVAIAWGILLESRE
jgi:hypothetical protein